VRELFHLSPNVHVVDLLKGIRRAIADE